MTRPGSISQCISDVQRSGSTAALERICDRYYEQLARIAGRKLQSAGRVADPHAIANDVLFEFFDRSQRGDFDGVASRNDLLPLLIRLTRDRVADEMRRMLAQKRGGGKTRGHSIFKSNGDRDVPNGFDNFVATNDTASTRQILMEGITHIVELLPDQTMRTILILKSEGYKNEEIAQELNVSVATVERKRKRIRELLGALEPDRQKQDKTGTDATSPDS